MLFIATDHISFTHSAYVARITTILLDFPLPSHPLHRRIPRLPQLPGGVAPLKQLTFKGANEKYNPPYWVPLGKSQMIPDSLEAYYGTEGPCAAGTGAVSRSRGYCDYFYQRIHLPGVHISGNEF